MWSELSELSDAVPEMMSAPDTVDTDATVVIAGAPRLQTVITAIEASYNAKPVVASNPSLVVKEGGVVVKMLYWPSEGPGPLSVRWRFAAGAEVTVTLTKGGAGVKGSVNVSAAWVLE